MPLGHERLQEHGLAGVEVARKLVVVTGANSGTGKEAARRLAGAGARMVLAVRTPEKGEAAKAEILREHPAAQLEVRRVDLADLVSVEEFAADLLAAGTPVDTLVDNAAPGAGRRPGRPALGRVRAAHRRRAPGAGVTGVTHPPCVAADW
ncbi:SDR family NAD(P)-dependent oxidoreductase [Pseudonocardia kujensis]|uniref:SDR family NAD(P)-dependent oxidoreductase n=1 Tax=Pseudonocardia kujensis TaxID=1128675 RepID=UPI001E646322|nr:SDR family NAD(P)-dependent oxidoreductase [Pseudonocardia kujensis]MCE0761677.1 SDR family NAD(P)-dependent oxidoreductase [Pseudonocardia kujensis]